MFTQFRNIDTAFKHIKGFCIALIIACIAISCFAVWKSYEMVNAVQAKIYILANGKAIEAFSAERKDNLPVEIRNHVKTFHHYFFTLDPDEKVIQANTGKALNLADHSARREYDNLREKGYYHNIIAANISARIEVDSTEVNINEYPYSFKCYATQQLIRATSTVTRTMVTKGYLRDVSRSDNNPHGLLIQQWEIIEN